MALRAGVPVADVEFVQFHPTALHHPAMPRPLISEALRGHGAVLRDRAGDRFVDELLPRDRVSRAIAVKLAEEGSDHVWLDATALEDFARRFPTIAESLAEAGFDPVRDWLPVAPAAHYLSGGVLVNLDGATALPGLWAAGEVACSGVHGANRLASNSLLEGMVFGARCVDAILSGQDAPEPTGALAGLDTEIAQGLPGDDMPRPIPVRPVVECRCRADHHLGSAAMEFGDSPHPIASAAAHRSALQAAMTSWAGVVRDASSLALASRAVNSAAAELGSTLERATAEVRNLTDVARALLEAATEREETRGSQVRSDFPDVSPAFLCRLSHDTDGGAQPANDPQFVTGRPLYRDDVHPPAMAIRHAVAIALAEDVLPLGDLSSGLMPEDSRGRAAFVAREQGVVAGTRCAEQACVQVDPGLEVNWLVKEGGEIGQGGVIGRVEGPLRSLLTAERTALNFLCHLSGVATAARRYVEAAREANPSTRIWDTRKTTPGLRSLEKAAVRASPRRC